MKATELSNNDLKNLVTEVATAAGINPPLIGWNPVSPTGLGEMGPFPVIWLNPEEMSIYTSDELKGVIAHEIGHLVLGHLNTPPSDLRPQPVNWQFELGADRFAARIGYRQETLSSFETTKQVVDSARDSYSHPSLDRRIANLQTQE